MARSWRRAQDRQIGTKVPSDAEQVFGGLGDGLGGDAEVLVGVLRRRRCAERRHADEGVETERFEPTLPDRGFATDYM